ncbi:NAD-dependent epimerase/dehydratase [beta proteobacterium KB13]|uniref:NAD-dependent epimerase/dehydratase n=1 Tax=beta proteobacterium KB13 TaxID=314607 RepID=B6BTL7_9PROT|nr:NAD-dependent epimerase/dehydratase [beta proteobacterium KB13]
MSLSILVTGGAGYLGSTLVPVLLDRGFDVTVVDNFFYKQSSLNQLCKNPNFSIVNGDVRIKETIKPLIKKTDIVIPLAAYVGAPLCKKDPIGASSVNKDSIFMLLELLSPNQSILMPTTNSAYGSGDENNFCTEESPLRPISQYAIEKVEVEQRLMEFSNFISFRLATVFGMSPRMRMDLLVNDFCYRAVNDKFIVLFESHFKRNYIHVADVAKAFTHGIDNFETMRGNVFNVGLSSANLSKLELCEEIKKQIPDFVITEAKVGKDPDQRNYIVSNEKIEKTGYIPDVTLRDGISELIKGYQMIKNNQYSNI